MKIRLLKYDKIIQIIIQLKEISEVLKIILIRNFVFDEKISFKRKKLLKEI